jgi:tripartite-type tricarboxylate transporter receptor subunit TctC
MTVSRRDLLQLAGCAAAIFPAVSSIGQAQTYPSRPVRVLVGFAAGSAGDIIARLTAERLSARLGQQFVIDNRPGAGSNLAIEALVNSPADGYTLGLANVGNAIGATLNERPGFDITRDIAPIAGIVRGTSVMEVSPSFPAKTVPDFLAYARANPGKLNFASGGVGTVQHVAGELFKMMTGINMVHVPYRGTPAALTDLVTGRVHVIFDNVVSSIEHIRSGQLRAVAVTTASRSSALPKIPTVGEFVPGFEASTWAGLAAPKGTAGEIVAILNKAITAVLANPQLKARFADMGSTVLAGSPSDFHNLIADETKKWAKVVAFSGAKSG